MRKFNRLIAYVLVVGLVLTAAYIISAQQEGEMPQRPRQWQQRRQMDPEAIIKRRIEQVMTELNLSEEETAVLKPMIEGILRTRMEQSREMRQLIVDLQNAIEEKDDTQIKA